MKNVIIVLMGLMTISFSHAQESGKKKTETILIQTATHCKENACSEYKEYIETCLNYLKGVVYAELDYTTRMVTVKYKVSQVTPEQIRQAIADTGYDADDVKATPKGIEKLPVCCKP